MPDEQLPDFRSAFDFFRHDGMHCLGTIVNYAEALQRGWVGPLNEEQEKFIEAMRASARDAIEVWRRMTVFVRMSDPTQDSKTVPVLDVIDEVRSGVQSRVPAADFRVPELDSQISGHPTLLTEALSYLLYPPDQQRGWTHPAPHLSIDEREDQKLDVRIVSALQVPPNDTQMRWLHEPGSSVQIATYIIQSHGGRLAIDRTDSELVFAFTLPVM